MREILFRGMSVHRKTWVYGSVIHQKDYYGKPVNRWFIIEGDYTEHYDIDCPIEVIPESVGQYTGIKDKEGTKIFEGDIVRNINWKYEKGIVKFETGTFDDGIYEYNGWVVEKEDGDVDHNPLIQYGKDSFGCDYGFEVIGNIYDNLKIFK